MFLEKEMATHSSILAWKNPMYGGAWQATVQGVAKSDPQLSIHTCTQICSRNEIKELYYFMLFNFYNKK